jgi:hypothetical protein
MRPITGENVVVAGLGHNRKRSNGAQEGGNKAFGGGGESGDRSERDGLR